MQLFCTDGSNATHEGILFQARAIARTLFLFNVNGAPSWAPHANLPVNHYRLKYASALVVVVGINISSGMEADVLAIQRSISHQTALVVDEDFHAIAELRRSGRASLQRNS
jgi:hypothetical protein